MVPNFITEEEGEIKEIYNRLRKRNFKGAGGQIIKNSSYQLANSLIAKFGSLFFTILIARLLAPELFGLYSLALSTIVLFSSFSDLGITTALLTYSSKALGKGNLRKAKTFFKGLLKYKIYLLGITSFLLLVLGYFVANFYYNKPIYFALIVGAIYIPIVGLMGYLINIFHSDNNFKHPMFKEIIFQVTRFFVVPTSILFLLKMNLKPSILIAIIILLISFCYFIGLVYLRFLAKRKIDFLKVKGNGLSTEEKKELMKFILPLSVTALSGMFFGYVDTFMLGHYVDAIHIGYYGAAFGLIGSAGAIIGFIGASVLPVFSREKGNKLNLIFKKTRNFTFLIGILAFIFTIFIAKYILLIAYGNDYLPSTLILQLLAITLIINPISGIYNAYFTSIKKTSVIAKLLIFSTIINVILNYFFITYGLQFGMMEGVLGACIATICSRVVYLGGLVVKKT